MILDRMSLVGKVALITGASRGLGRGAAFALAEAGADVGLVARTRVNLEPVAEEIKQLGRRVLSVTADVAEPGQVQNMVKEIAHGLGHVDILVNFAGTNWLTSAVEYPLAEWHRILNTNLLGTFLCCQEVAKLMISQGGGKIINTASMLSVIGVPNMPAYAASKGGIVQLTKALAVEWAPYHINVNAIGPGYYRTDLTRAVYENEKRRTEIVRRIPMGRWGDPEDLQGAVVFLASAAAEYVTGQVLYVDGGFAAA